jgi:hypothetical protein
MSGYARMAACCCALLASACLQPTSLHYRQRAWVVPSGARVAANDDPAASTGAVLFAGRGESRGFQLVVPSAAGDGDLELTASDLKGPAKQKIAASNYTFYREGYVQVLRSSPDLQDGNRPLWPGWYADPLIPLADPASGRPIRQARRVPAENSPPGSNQVVWADLFIPRETEPGRYEGTIDVVSAGATIDVSVEVWNFVVPLRPLFKSSFGVHSWRMRDRATHELLLDRKSVV